MRKPVLLEPREVLESERRSLRAIMPENIDIAMEVDWPAPIHADPSQLQQLLLNLCLNARDALPGGGRLSIRVLADEDQGAEGIGTIIEVRDSGQGYDAGGAGPSVRAILHHEGGSWDGPRLGHGAERDATKRGPRYGRDGSRSGDGRKAALSARRSGLAGPDSDGPAVERAECERAGRPKTKQKCARSSYARCAPPGTTWWRPRTPRPAWPPLRASRVGSGFSSPTASCQGGPSPSWCTGIAKQRPQGKVLVCSGYLEDVSTKGLVEEGRAAFLAKPVRAKELARAVAELLRGRECPAEVTLSDSAE